MTSRPDRPTVVFLVSTAAYFWSHRLPLARAARAAGFRVVVACRAESRVEAMKAEGFEVRPIPISRTVGAPWNEARTLAAILRVYRHERPLLAQNVSVKCALYGALCARLAGVPAVVSILPGLGYVFRSPDWRARALRPAVRLAFRNLLGGSNSRVVVQNADDEAYLRSRGLAPPGGVVVVRGSGVDLKRFQPRPEPPGPVAVAMVSRMLWDKGVRELVEAVGRLRARGVALRLELVGAPDPENPGSIPGDRLAEWNRSGAAEWSGPSEDVPGVWAQAHIAVLPSYYGEGVPKSLLEAAACGRPIVAADVPGAREIVRHGENGLLVPPRDVPALAGALERLAADPNLRRQMGERGRQIAAAEFGEDIVVEKTLHVYRELLGKRYP